MTTPKEVFERASLLQSIEKTRIRIQEAKDFDPSKYLRKVGIDLGDSTSSQNDEKETQYNCSEVTIDSELASEPKEDWFGLTKKELDESRNAYLKDVTPLVIEAVIKEVATQLGKTHLLEVYQLKTQISRLQRELESERASKA